MSYRDSIKEDTLHHLRINVRTLRLAAGLTLKKAAERGEMHWRHWHKIEMGEINVTLVTLARLAHVLQVDAAALIGDWKRQLN